MMRRLLKRKQCAGSVLIYVKKEIHSKWNAVAKVPLDLYTKNVQSGGFPRKATKIAKCVGKRFKTCR